MYKVGDKVTWKSQAGGHEKEKTGEILFVIPPGKLPMDFPLLPWPYVYGGSTCIPRDHESYLVCVGRRFYWPRVKHLRLVSKEVTNEDHSITEAEAKRNIELLREKAERTLIDADVASFIPSGKR